MKHDDSSQVDYLFKQVNDEITWDKVRQDQVRQSILLSIDRTEHGEGTRKNHLFKRLVPLLAFLLLIGIGSTLFLTKVNPFEDMSKQEGHINHSSGEESTHNYLSIFTKENEENIRHIQETGFDLRLPTHIPIDNLAITGPVLRDQSVSAYFYRNKERVLGFVQESIADIDMTTNRGFKEIKDDATDVITINGQTTYIQTQTIGPSDLERIQLNLVTDQYAFLLYTDVLTEDEIIQVAKSINISDL